MQAGKLNKYVELLTASESQGDDGAITKSWATTAWIWASIEPLQGREHWLAQQVNAETTVRIRIRYRSDVTEECRIRFGTRIYEINSLVDPAERNAELELLCKETK